MDGIESQTTAPANAPPELGLEIQFPVVVLTITDLAAYRELIEFLQARDMSFRLLTGAEALLVFGGHW